MNYDVIRYVLARIIELTGFLMLLPLIVCIYYGEKKDAYCFLIVAAVCILVGFLYCRFAKPKKKAFYAREGFVSTALAWIILSLIGAVPFYISGSISSYLDAVFETVSGFTTTGSTILTNPALLGNGMQFWRCFTHWIGGMGILVFMLAILPMTADGYSMHLMRAESPGPSVGKYVPKIKDTAKILYEIYFVITIVQIVLLMMTGLGFLDSCMLAFSTAGTGGFGLVQDSCASYSMATRNVIIIFMTLCGVNFSIYYFLITKRFKEILKNDEVRWYLILMFASSVLIAINVVKTGIIDDFGTALHHALFSVSSIMTTTGFASIDYNTWPQFSRTLLVVLTCIGGCAGSTAGGFKISRIVIIFRNAKNEILKTIHPKSIQKVNMDGRVVDDDTVRGVNAYLTLYALIFVLSILAVSLFESWNSVDLVNYDFETNVTAVVATLNNTGPGLNIVGPAGGFSGFSALSKAVLIFDMLAGRLELLPVLLLFNRRTWKKNF